LLKLIVSHRCDDQSLDACRAFVSDLKERLVNVPFYTSDELGHYMVVLWKCCRLDPDLCWDALPFDQRKNAVLSELDYAVFHKERKKGRVIRVKQYVIYGDENRTREKLKGSQSQQINTAFIRAGKRDASAVRRQFASSKPDVCQEQVWV